MTITRFIKTTLLSVACGCMSLVSCTKNEPTDAENMNLQGNVKFVKEYMYEAKENFGEITTGDPFRPNGWDMEYYFNENGMLDSIVQIKYTGEEVGSMTFIYNEQGKLVCQNSYDSDGGFVEKSIFKYDDKGRKKEVVKFLSDDNMDADIKIEYDDDESTVTTTIYDHKGNRQRKTVEKKDKRGYPVTTKMYNKDGDLTNWRDEKFNGFGLREEIIIYGPDEKPEAVIKYEYDKFGDVVSQHGTDENGESFIPMKWEYKRDDHNNWTQMIEYEGDKAVYLTTREISYY